MLGNRPFDVVLCYRSKCLLKIRHLLHERVGVEFIAEVEFFPNCLIVEGRLDSLLENLAWSEEAVGVGQVCAGSELTSKILFDS